MAYALVSLIQILEQDQHHLDLDAKPQIETLIEKVSFLRDLVVEKSSRGVEDLGSRIRDVAYKAEDLIESHIRDQVLSDLKDGTSQLNLEDVMEEFDSIEKEIFEIRKDPGSVSSASASSSPDCDRGSETIVVGLADVLPQLLDQLTGRESGLRIIPIVGMGGIGKTTLAQQLYDHPLIVDHFDIRVWITITLESTTRVILLDILGCLRNITDELRQSDDDKLGEHIRKFLWSHRYLIIVDDVRDIDAWDKIRWLFVNDSNHSRIMLTTRERTVADYATYSSNCFQMHLMNESASWNLLSLKVFGKEGCPHELETIGKNIAKRCQGLPLAITLMARFLSTINKKLAHWEHVIMNISSVEFLLDSDLHILSSSYNRLPWYLKPCFLYMGVFPEDYEIRASKIIKLWIAEGFLEQITDNNLEDTAEAYLKVLINANLLLACKREQNGKVRTFKIHFLFRELCQKKAVEEKFLWFKNLEDHKVPGDEYFMRRVSVHPLAQPSKQMKFTSLVRSFLCIGHASLRLAPLFLGLTLLRVLDVFQLEFFHFPTEILKLVNLRYLAFSCHAPLPSSISRLRNLQILVIRRLQSFKSFSLPSELWEMTQLRHVKCKETCVWYYPENEISARQMNLQTLSTLQMSVTTDKLLKFIPNLRKLGLFCNASVHSVIHLDHLHKLEKLKCSSNLSRVTHNFLSYLTFPPSLRKLTLNVCKIPWGFMNIVGSLASLEQLRLQKCDFLGIGNKPIELASKPEHPEWEATAPTWVVAEDQFHDLKFLQMEDLNLVHWKASEAHLPRLEHLVIRGCCSLSEIPLEIGDIPTLNLIEVDEYCSRSVIASAKKIQEESIELGNDSLVHIGGTRGIFRSGEYEDLASLNEQEIEQKQEREVKRKNYMKKLKDRMSLNEQKIEQTHDTKVKRKSYSKQQQQDKDVDSNTPPTEPPKSSGATKLANLLGLLRIRVKRGINLAVRNVGSSYTYLVVKMGKQKLKTLVIRKDVNPEWNEDLTFSITDPDLPILLSVYNWNTFSKDERIGEAELDAKPFIRAFEKRGNLPSGTVITRIQPSRSNCLAEESCVIWRDGHLVQDMILRLKNVECGEVELQLQWIDLPTTMSMGV